MFGNLAVSLYYFHDFRLYNFDEDGDISDQLYLKPNAILNCEFEKILGSSYLAGKKVKTDSNKLTAIQEHFLCCNYSPSLEEFSILTRESNQFTLKITENPLIVRYKPVLNNAHSSLPLELFQYTSVVII